jgi:hypothetical protein
MNSSVRRAFESSATCWLLMVTPFVVFLEHYTYPLARPEIAICAGVAACIAGVLGAVACRWRPGQVIVYAALIVLLADVQFARLQTALQLLAVFAVAAAVLWAIRAHATEVVGLMAATMLTSTILLPAAGPGAPERAKDSGGNKRLPMVLHIVLDEHLGADAFPGDAESQQFAVTLRRFFSEQRFVLFTRAYSEYFATHRSLSHLMNYASHTFDGGLYRIGDGEFEYTLTRNAHVRALIDHGYHVRLYQSTHLNYCTPDIPEAECITYSFANISVLAGTSLSASAKASIIGEIYTSRFTVYDELRDRYESVRVHAGKWLHLPKWSAKANNIGPIISMDTLERLQRDLAHAQGGDYYFAHLLLPHEPYAFDSACRIRPVSDWLQAYVARVGDQPVNTEESRRLRYSRYVEQLTCLYSRLTAVVNAIPEGLRADAVIVMQGDHGSRITVREPNVATVDRMTAADFADSFRTLFAVRAPNLQPTARPDDAAITCVFSALARNGFESLAGIDSCGKPEVYVSGRANQPGRWVPLPPLSAISDTSATAHAAARRP